MTRRRLADIAVYIYIYTYSIMYLYTPNELSRAGILGILFFEMIIDPNFLYFITKTIENQLNNTHLS